MNITNLINDYAANSRTTWYFREEAILAVRMSHRVLEYLRPDSHFGPSEPLNKYVVDLIFVGRFAESAQVILGEIEDLHGCTVDSSQGIENILAATAKLIGKLVAEDQEKLDKEMVE